MTLKEIIHMIDDDKELALQRFFGFLHSKSTLVT